MSEPLSEPGPPAKLGSLELGRFLAALMIMVSHEINMLRIEPGLHGAGLLGWFDVPQPPAVDYFFVLSGFVMMTAHGGELGTPGAAWRFARRRVWRIYPVYWLALSVPVFLYWRITTLPHLLQLVTLGPTEPVEYIGVAWTLRYEVAFYLVFGLVLLPRIGRAVLWLWVGLTLAAWLPAVLHGLDQAISTAWRFHVVKTPLLMHYFYIFDVLFMGGMAAGTCFRHRRLSPWQLAACLLLAAGGLTKALADSDWGFAYGSPANFTLFTVALGLLILGCAELERQGRWHFGPWSMVLGKLSYPLYVVHSVVTLLANIIILRWHAAEPSPVLALVMIMLATVIGTVAVAILYDQPVQNWGRRRRNLFNTRLQDRL